MYFYLYRAQGKLCIVMTLNLGNYRTDMTIIAPFTLYRIRMHGHDNKFRRLSLQSALTTFHI